MHATSKRNVPGIIEQGLLVGGKVINGKQKDRGAIYLGYTVASLRPDEILVTIDGDEAYADDANFMKLNRERS